ncbi:unnamed protein product [Urochloa humidicola]
MRRGAGSSQQLVPLAQLVPYPLCNARASEEQTPPRGRRSARAAGPSVSGHRGTPGAGGPRREGRGSQRMPAGTRRRLTRGHGGGSSGVTGCSSTSAGCHVAGRNVYSLPQHICRRRIVLRPFYADVLATFRSGP